MARKIIWTVKAQSDRKFILSYWIERNKSLAYSKKLNKQFKEATALLKIYPDAGQKINRENTKG